MAMRAHADVPMAAMWAYGKDNAPRPTFIGDIRGAASVAHIYGQNLVAAESFTSAFSPWAFAPSDLKHIADMEFALGVNRPVIHTSVHSPMDDHEPGLSLAIFGQYFNRHETWAGMARPWVDYLARSSFLLQQGRHVADIAYFYGEEAPLTALNLNAPLADVPLGYGFDYVNADVLAHALEVADRDLISKSGARYRLLYLGGTSRRMTLPTLRRIAALAEAGATVVGNPPTASPSLADDPAAFARLVARLWPATGNAHIGRGRVIAGDLAAALQRLGLDPDVALDRQVGGAAILVQHRRLPDADIYYLANTSQHAFNAEAKFRVAGREAAIWHADSGATEPVSFRIEHGRTRVPLMLGPLESTFFVFRRPIRGRGEP